MVERRKRLWVRKLPLSAAVIPPSMLPALLLRLGADVTILYRRLRQDMPAAEEEIKAAEEEGIKIEYLVAPLKIEGTKGKVSSITCQRMTLGDFDNSGRKKPVAVAGSEFTLKVDAIIAAIGQVPDMSFIDKKSGS